MKLDKLLDDTLLYKKMKKIYPLILALLFFFLFTFPVKAVRNEATQGAGIGVGRTISQEKIGTVQARLNARKKELIKNYFQVMTRRLEAAISRLNRLITRIELRMAKIEVNNEDIDTKPIKKQVQEGKDKLQTATDKLNEAKTKIDEVLDSETPKKAFAEVRDIIKEIKQILIDVHRILVKVIGDIKGLRVGTTSTPSATPTE